MAPLPARVGIRETTVAPQENARSTDSASHRSCSRAGMNGGAISRKTRTATSRPRSAFCRRGKLFERHALVQSLERVRVRRFQPHRDFESGRPGTLLAVERVEETGPLGCRSARDATRPRLGRAPQVPRRSRHSRRRAPRADRRSSTRCTTSSASRSRHASPGRSGLPRFVPGIAPAGVSLAVVPRHRSHITHRQAHSLPVRKTVAVRATAWRSVTSSSRTRS